jgi:hypothetical protein
VEFLIHITDLLSRIELNWLPSFICLVWILFEVINHFKTRLLNFLSFLPLQNLWIQLLRNCANLQSILPWVSIFFSGFDLQFVHLLGRLPLSVFFLMGVFLMGSIFLVSQSLLQSLDYSLPHFPQYNRSWLLFTKWLVHLCL